MRKIFLLLAVFICTALNAQYLGPKQCDWHPDNNFRYYHIRCGSEDSPEIWRKYRQAYCIYGIDNGWRIRRRNYYIVPEYVVMKEFDLDRTPSVRASLEYAYNYLVMHPEKTKWEGYGVIVLTRVLQE